VSPPDPISGIARQFGPGAKFGLRAGWPAGADPDVEGLVDQIVSGTAAQRARLFTRFYASLNASAPFVPLFASAQTVVSAKNVSNIIYNPQWTIDFAALR
jgi:peptide/nickel transport system substrate-binding protein